MRDNTAEVRARGTVNFLIKSGKVEKRACEICGKKYKLKLKERKQC